MGGKCSRCGKSILWGVSATTNAKIPVDLDIASVPDDTNLKGVFFEVVQAPGVGIELYPVDLEKARSAIDLVRRGVMPAREYGVSHFKTCPYASAFGKGRK